jgi:hypothetical protein
MKSSSRSTNEHTVRRREPRGRKRRAREADSFASPFAWGRRFTSQARSSAFRTCSRHGPLHGVPYSIGWML